MKKSYEIDMCHGPLLGKILLFSIPLMLSSILQLLSMRRISLWWAGLRKPGPGSRGLHISPYQSADQYICGTVRTLR